MTLSRCQPSPAWEEVGGGGETGGSGALEEDRKTETQ